MYCSPARIPWIPGTSAAWPGGGDVFRGAPGALGGLAGRRDRLRVDAGRLHRRDRAAGGAVVGGVDADELALADRRDRLLHPALPLVGRPVGGVVLLADFEAGGVDPRVRALLEELGVFV